MAVTTRHAAGCQPRQPAPRICPTGKTPRRLCVAGRGWPGRTRNPTPRAACSARGPSRLPVCSACSVRIEKTALAKFRAAFTSPPGGGPEGPASGWGRAAGRIDRPSVGRPWTALDGWAVQPKALKALRSGRPGRLGRLSIFFEKEIEIAPARTERPRRVNRGAGMRGRGSGRLPGAYLRLDQQQARSKSQHEKPYFYSGLGDGWGTRIRT